MAQKKINGSTFNLLTKSLLGQLSGDQKMELLNRYLTKEVVMVLEDKELIGSIDAFLKNSLNVSETSRNAFMHRNTLLYRLDKIYRLTKFNIRNFEDAVVFKLLELIYKDVYKK